MKALFERMKELLHLEVLDEESSRMIERIVIIRISTKHINLWIRQFEMKRREMSELAWLMGFEEIQVEIEKEKALEAWAKRCTTTSQRR